MQGFLSLPRHFGIIFLLSSWSRRSVLSNSSMAAGGAFWPVLLIANIAALIASRAMTTATFSCIKQSTALGCFPRLKIIHTSRKFMGQIYIPVINWFLLVVCLVFVCSISSNTEMGNAYGTASSFFFFGFTIFVCILCYTLLVLWFCLLANHIFCKLPIVCVNVGSWGMLQLADIPDNIFCLL